jgi:hypothetical protein
MMEEKRLDCEKEFIRIWDRLSNGDKKFEAFKDKNSEQDIELSTIKAHMTHLIDSMSGLTKAIWGMVSAIILMLLGFLIWYIQSGNH